MRDARGCPFGTHRAGGQMPQPAERIDPSPEIWRNELLFDVEFLNLDSSSMRQIAEEAGGDTATIARRITEIVGERGKMHNPVTRSGGVAVGRIREVGPGHPAHGTAPGTLICSGVSLSLTPLTLSAIHEIDVRSAQLRVTGQAVLHETAHFGVLPEDFDLRSAMAVMDVCGAPTVVHRSVAPGERVAIMGAGKAGLLAAVAAREALGPAGEVVVFDVDAAALAEIAALDIASATFQADLTDAVATFAGAEAASGGALFDFVVSATNAAGAETGAILATRQGGRILFFGMATNFQVAALSAEGVGKDIAMLIGNGYALGGVDFAFDLLRSNPAARALLERRLAGPG